MTKEELAIEKMVANAKSHPDPAVRLLARVDERVLLDLLNVAGFELKKEFD